MNRDKLPELWRTPVCGNRRHGPAGYADYGSYRPWLRDEFHYRCAYCAVRETWMPSPSDFAIDHVLPQSQYQSLSLDYNNLAYACHTCNLRKLAHSLPDPLLYESLSSHLECNPDGTMNGTTTFGQFLIGRLLLNNSERVRIRRAYFAIWQLLDEPLSEEKRCAIAALFSHPEDYPNLESLRPPGGNSRPEGIAESVVIRNSEQGPR